MKRQPRTNLRVKNFNFEQFSEYASIYEDARAKDETRSRDFYKLVKYVIKNKDSGPGNLVVRDFMRKYRLDLIDIPEEFQELEVDDFNLKKSNRARSRKRVYTRSDKSLTGYDVWRCFDRNLICATGKEKAVCKLMIPPALLRRAFGFPDKTQIAFAGTGNFEFEDSNLDLYRIHDYKQTDFYHGLNREDSFYLSEKNLKKPDHKRSKKWPTIEEFWNCEEPRPFRLLASDHADWRKFKRWFRNHLNRIENTPEFDYDTEALAKFDSVLDISLGDFDKKEEINTEMAIFKWSNQIYMTEKELKDLSEEMRVLKQPPTPMDLSKAERTVINKSDLKVQEIQAE